jgi:hypothetical protein
MDERPDLRRLARAALWGLVATLVMTMFMAAHLGWAAGRGHTWQSFPRLIFAQLLNRQHGVALILTAMAAHFAYGALAGLVFAYFARPMTFAKGVGFGLFVWFIMQITFVPWLGLSDFGLMRGGRFAFATLIDHLAYGVTLGVLGAHDETSHDATFDDLGRLQPQG